MAASEATSFPYKLELEPQKQSVFVTQLGERGDEEDDNVNRYPIVKESAGKLIETGLNTLQKTLLLKREVEVDDVTQELRTKRIQFQKRMEECEKKRVDLQKKQQLMKDRVEKFDKFISETEAKRRRAIHKYQQELKVKEQKQSEYDLLLQQLEELKTRHNKLNEKIKKYKKFEEFLMKVLDNIPENYLEVNDDMLRSIMDRHRTLSFTNYSLVNRVQSMYDEVDEKNLHLDELKYKHDQSILVINKDLAEMQHLQEERIDMNAELEEMIFNDAFAYRDQSETLGRIKMAINNLVEKCHKKHDEPMETLDYEEKLHLIMNFVVDKIHVERMARQGFVVSSASSGKRERSRTKLERT
ncbi:coiled-coil domain-containing protein 42 homolog [Lytechinus variegatus]|uniref:coiled-coil domain-containing protein 42 homolog n=1 Tax=Lytechinus variegatus TaxID=7654 RepID=UPI001BB26208|nr:coiled-coil domain-containing protein 42 homolog [Lytechinus variegatus]